jgi:hypothetical protein
MKGLSPCWIFVKVAIILMSRRESTEAAILSFENKRQVININEQELNFKFAGKLIAQLDQILALIIKI